MLTVAILVGGLATRLHPITEAIPKSLIEVAGQPFIYHQLEYLRKQGINSVVMCTGFLGDKICKVVGDGSRWDMQIQYSADGKTLLGTGGAIRQALPLLGEYFYILYGDSYLPINFTDVQKTYEFSKKKGLMTIYRNKNQWDKSNVEYDAGCLIEYNKNVTRPQMNYIDYGLGLLKRSVFDSYPTDNPLDLSKVYNDLSLDGELFGYEVFDRFYEIGSFEGIKDAEAFLLKTEKKGNL
jgi:MurNAc alpha-1-phosphate uridylyltransferase